MSRLRMPAHLGVAALGLLGVGCATVAAVPKRAAMSSPVVGMVFVGNGGSLFAGLRNGNLLRWDPAAAQPSVVNAGAIPVTALCASPRETVLVGYADGSVREFNTDGSPRGSHRPPGPAAVVALACRGSQTAILLANGEVCLVSSDGKPEQVLQAPNRPNDPALAVALETAKGDRDGVWVGRTSATVDELAANRSAEWLRPSDWSARQLYAGPTGILAGGYLTPVGLTEAGLEELGEPLAAHLIKSMSVDAAGQVILTGHVDGTVMLWRRLVGGGGKAKYQGRTFESESEPVRAVAISPDADRVAIARGDSLRIGPLQGR